MVVSSNKAFFFPFFPVFLDMYIILRLDVKPYFEDIFYKKSFTNRLITSYFCVFSTFFLCLMRIFFSFFRVFRNKVLFGVFRMLWLTFSRREFFVSVFVSRFFVILYFGFCCCRLFIMTNLLYFAVTCLFSLKGFFPNDFI